MSVINQMLKDLDKRQVNQQQSSVSVGDTVSLEKSSTNLILVIVATIVVTLFAVYFWQLHVENNMLTQQMAEKTNATSQVTRNKIPLSTSPSSANFAPRVTPTLSLTTSVSATTKTVVSDQPKISQGEITQKTVKPQSISDVTIKQVNMTKAKVNTDIIDAAKEEKTKIIQENATTTLSISRRQLTPQALSKQKMKKAEMAITNGKYSKAENLFEDVLLLVPTNAEARMQLAALWFGRHLYQPALNVLSQGVALAPENEKFRLMQAKIYAKQGRNQVALNTLKKLANTNNLEYQSLLAGLSQQLADFDSAIAAYQHLITLQANSGRWYLGLAISYDGNSQFSLAKSSYNKAIEQGDLSKSSRQFAQQRIVQLGE